MTGTGLEEAEHWAVWSRVSDGVWQVVSSGLTQAEAETKTAAANGRLCPEVFVAVPHGQWPAE